MNILFRWSMRMLRENPVHTVFTILNLVFSYMLLTCLKLLTQYRISFDNTDGDGLLWYVAEFFSIVVVLTTLLTMRNAFLTSVRERKCRYEMLSAAGTTKRQIRGSLFLEALVINCIGALVGIALGLALFAALKLFSQDIPDEWLVWLQREGIKQLLPRIRPESKKTFDGFFYMPTPQRGVYCLLLEFLSVPMAMAGAARRHLPRRVLRPGPPSLGRLLGRLCGVGGMINRLIDRRERPHRRFFLSVFAIGIVSMAITFNVFWLMERGVYTDTKHLYLRTSGDNIRFEERVDDYLEGEDFRRVAEEVRIYRSYLPRVYCLIGGDQIAQSTKEALRQKNVRDQPFLYPVSGSNSNLAIPQMLFVQESEFAVLCSHFVGEGDIDALLLPGRDARGDGFAWLESGRGIQELELCFYTDPQARYMIYDARTKNEAEDARSGSSGEPVQSDKVQPKFSYTDADTDVDITDAETYLKAVKGKTAEKIRVKVWQLPPDDSDPFSPIQWDINRALPTLVFPESAKCSFAAHLLDTNDGVRMSAQEREDILQLSHALRNALQDASDGYVAEHPFGTGTRYLRGGSSSTENESVYAVPFLHVFSSKPPKPIYADIRLRFDGFEDPELLGILVITIALIWFALLTNIINAVNGYHTLRRHDHAVLQSCGMSEKQLRKAILYEALWYSVHSMLYGIAGYLMLFPVCLLLLARGASYEQITRDTALLAEWCSIVLINLQHAYGNLLNSAKFVWPVFLMTFGVMIVLFLLANVVTLRRMRADALVPRLKKDI